MTQITHILERAGLGDRRAAEELLTIVYEELRRLARAKMVGESAGHTLQPTALVHEAWLRLGADDQPARKNRAHFFGAAAEAMRRILIERARRRLAAKRGGLIQPLDADELGIPPPTTDDDKLSRVNEAVEKLARIDPREADLVKLRYSVGLSFEVTAAALGIAVPTAKQWWAYTRAWLAVGIRSTEAPRAGVQRSLHRNGDNGEGRSRTQ